MALPNGIVADDIEEGEIAGEELVINSVEDDDNNLTTIQEETEEEKPVEICRVCNTDDDKKDNNDDKNDVDGEDLDDVDDSEDNTEEKRQQWMRDGLQQFAGNGNYSASLYNLAWAKGVQCRSREEELVKQLSINSNFSGGKRGAEDLNTASSSSSSDVDEVKEGVSKKSIKINVDLEMKEEGELEEGEISNSSGSPVSNSSASPTLSSENTTRERHTSSSRRRSESSSRGISSRECSSSRHREKRYSDSRTRDPRRSHKSPSRERERERNRGTRLSDIADKLKNVRVKDAQKSFVGVCNTLQKAMVRLLEISSSSRTEEVVSIVKQVFSGMQAAYAVRNTAIGEQQLQEQDKHAFPRLLEHAINEASRLFTAKQIKELEGMLHTVNSGFRISKNDNAEVDKVNLSPAIDSFQMPQENGRALQSFETLENSFHKENSSQNIAGQLSANPKNFNAGNRSSRPDSAVTGSLPHRNDTFSSSALEDTTSSRRFYGREGPSGCNLSTMMVTSSLETGRATAYIQTQNPKTKPPGGQAYKSTQSSSVKSVKQESTGRIPWQADPVKAITDYQEKFKAKVLSNGSTLPSPTPSDDEDDDLSNPTKETPVSSYSRDSQQKAEHSGLYSFHKNGLNGLPNIEPNSLEMADFVLSKTDQTICYSEGFNETSRAHKGRQANIETGNLQKLHFKSRDPRLKAVDVEPNDQHSHDLQDDAKMVEDPIFPKPFVDPYEQIFSSTFPVMSSGRGGWLEESTVTPASNEWGDRILEMNMDISQLDSVSNDMESGRDDIVPEDNTLDYHSHNKRQKTESNGESQVSLSSKSEATEIFSHGNDQPVISVGMKNNDTANLNIKKERDQKGNSPGNSSLPFLLENIAVNPTMLMDEFVEENQRLSTQSVNCPLDQGKENVQPHFTFASDKQFISTNENGASTSSLDTLSILPKFKVQQHTLPLCKAPSEMSAVPSGTGKRKLKPRDPRRKLLMNMEEENVQSSATGSIPPRQTIPKLEEIISSCSYAEDKVTKTTEIKKPDNIHSQEQFVVSEPSREVSQAFSSKNSISEPNRQVNGNNVNLGIDEISKLQELDHEKAVPSSPVSDLETTLNVQGAANRNHGDPWGDVDHFLEGLSEEQKSAIQQERARRIEEQNKMFSNRKLCLVLDLDHTLLNSAKFSEIEPTYDEILRKKEEQDREKSERQLFRFSHMAMYTKLRPGIWKFLDRASKLFELHVYTMGNKVYATEMARVLDPTGKLFAGRVISKGDESDDGDGLPKSKDLDGVLGMESAVLIIDDSARVWPHHRHNLIVVERYMYFPCSRKQFGLSGPSLLEADVDERPEDGTLASCLAVIEKIHQNFFLSKLLHEVDVRDFLAEEQRRILSGCRVVFSRVFPVGEAQPHLHPLWQMAEQFGATCTTQIDEQVTHVVALASGTDKVNWAQARGRYVVYPGWVEASALLYRRANERDFAITLNHFPTPQH